MRDFLHQHQIDRLFHFTQANNLKNIFKYGLLPRENLEKERVEYVYNDECRYDECKNAICTSIEFPNYRMFYRLRMLDKNKDVDWVVLKIDANILLDCECAFCQENAASAKSFSLSLEERKGLSSLAKLYEDFPDMPTRNDINLQSWYPTNPQAEVLILGNIPVSYIQEVYFFDHKALHKYQNDIPNHIHASVDTRYFKPRVDWKYWQK